MLTAECLEKRAMLAAFLPNLGILSLDSSSTAALYASGTGGITVTGGDIVVDSSSTSGAKDGGKGNISANNIYVHSNLMTISTGKFLGSVHIASPVLADPLASITQPTATSPTFTNTVINNKTVTLLPGTYVGGILISGSSNVTLLPGLYFLQGGGLNVGGASKLTGTGVTIYNAPVKTTDSININGAAVVTLSAPTSGAYQGLVVFQNRTSTVALNIANTSTANFTGEIYAASALLDVTSSNNVNINSGGGGAIPGALIVKDVLVAGNGNLNVGALAGGPSGDLSIIATDNLGGSSLTSAQGAATAGHSVVYTVTVKNAGPSEALGATVSDVLPAFISGDTFTVVATGGAVDLTHAASGSGAIADTVNLPSGSTLTYTVTSSIKSTATGSMTNTPSVTAPAGFTDTNSANNSASDTDNFPVDLAITNTDGATSFVPGTQDTYTVVVTNNGPNSVTGATVADLLAANADIASDTFTVSASAGASDTTHASGSTVYTGSINDTVSLASGACITYTVKANIKSSATGSLVTTATATVPSGITDPVSTNNSATDTDTLTPHADLAITNTDGVTSFVPGTQDTYTIKVTNNGPSDVTGATVADLLAANAAITSDTFTVSRLVGRYRHDQRRQRQRQHQRHGEPGLRRLHHLHGEGEYQLGRHRLADDHRHGNGPQRHHRSGVDEQLGHRNRHAHAPCRPGDHQCRRCD